MSALAKINEAGAKTIGFLRAQLAGFEQELKHVQGVADVAASKRKLAAKREGHKTISVIDFFSYRHGAPRQYGKAVG